MIYTSKINKKNGTDVEKNLMDILTRSVSYNAIRGVTGVLYYGNGYFLQYIEGEKSDIEHLFYDLIVKDSRHYHCEILFSSEIDHISFRNWSMKFAPISQKIKKFFHDYHVDDFNPYLLTAESIPFFIEVLKSEPNRDVRAFNKPQS